MWYEILPSVAIIVGSLGLPGLGLWWLHRLVNGNHYRRSLADRWDRANYQRDMRVAGSPYIFQGLETLEDKKKDEKKDECDKDK